MFRNGALDFLSITDKIGIYTSIAADVKDIVLVEEAGAVS